MCAGIRCYFVRRGALFPPQVPSLNSVLFYRGTKTKNAQFPLWLASLPGRAHPATTGSRGRQNQNQNRRDKVPRVGCHSFVLVQLVVVNRIIRQSLHAVMKSHPLALSISFLSLSFSLFSPLFISYLFRHVAPSRPRTWFHPRGTFALPFGRMLTSFALLGFLRGTSQNVWDLTKSHPPQKKKAGLRLDAFASATRSPCASRGQRRPAGRKRPWRARRGSVRARVQFRCHGVLAACTAYRLPSSDPTYTVDPSGLSTGLECTTSRVANFPVRGCAGA